MRDRDTEFLDELANRLERDPADMDGTLERILEQLGCATGTIHRLGPAGQLELVAQRGLPDQLLPRVQSIPIGKGMAGLAAQRREPVQVCNLQTDCSGSAQPAARMTGMGGSIAVPVLAGDELCGVLGVATAAAHEFSPEEIAFLNRIAVRLAQRLRREP